MSPNSNKGPKDSKNSKGSKSSKSPKSAKKAKKAKKNAKDAKERTPHVLGPPETRGRSQIEVGPDDPGGREANSREANSREANSREVTVSVVVRGPAGAVVLVRRTEDDLWTVPADTVRQHETVAQAAVRACLEQAGLQVAPVGVVGVFSDPQHFGGYAAGNRSGPVDLCVRAVPAGKLTPTGQAREVVWVPPSRLANVYLHPAVRFRIDQVASDADPYLG